MTAKCSNDLKLRIFGTKGGLDVAYENNVSSLRACTGDDILTATWRNVETLSVQTNYQRFIDAVRSGEQVEPDFARGAALEKVLDLAVQSDGEGSRDLSTR